MRHKAIAEQENAHASIEPHVLREVLCILGET
jgi:hypothetical protein